MLSESRYVTVASYVPTSMWKLLSAAMDTPAEAVPVATPLELTSTIEMFFIELDPEGCVNGVVRAAPIVG